MIHLIERLDTSSEIEIIRCLSHFLSIFDDHIPANTVSTSGYPYRYLFTDSSPIIICMSSSIMKFS